MDSREASLFSELKALPRAAWCLFAGTFINKFGAFVIPFLALYLRQRGFTNADAAWALAAYGLGHIAASLLGGYLTDRIGRRRTIVLSMFSSAAAMLLLSEARSFPAIVAMTWLAGLTTELYRPASSALLADLVPAEQRVTAFAAYRWALNAGWAFGPATAGFLAKYSFQWLFIGDAISSVLFGCVAWATLPHGLRTGAANAPWAVAWQTMRADKRLHKLLLAQLAIALVFLQMSSTFGLHVTASGFSSATYGAIISMNGVLIVLVELSLTRHTRRWPVRPTIAAGYLLIGLGFALCGFAHTLPALIGVMLIYTCGEMIAMPVASAYIADSVPPDLRGRYMGAYGLMWALGLTLGPSAGLRLHARSPLILWGACGVLGIVAAVLVIQSGKRRES